MATCLALLGDRSKSSLLILPCGLICVRMFKLVAMLFHLFHHLGLASQILESLDVNPMARDYEKAIRV